MLAADFYDVLVAVVLGLVTLAVFLMLGTLLRHALVSLELRRQARRRAVLLPLLCRAINDPSERAELLAQLRRPDRSVLLPMLLQLALDLRGEELERVAELADELGLVRGERRRLRGLRATERTEAAKNLGLLRARAALPALLRLIERDRRRSVRLACAWAVGEIGGAEAVRGLLAMLDDPEPGVVRRVQEVLLDTAPDAAGEIVRHAQGTESAAARRAAVELLGALRDPLASELLLELVDTPDPELRTKVTKAAAAIGDPRFHDAFCQLLSDPVWSVRCQAATGLGAISAVDAIEALREAMADPVWWVRFNAASAPAELGPPGRAALAEATTDKDSPRAEVARYVLEHTGLARWAA
jgi:HEAT repeat protein